MTPKYSDYLAYEAHLADLRRAAEQERLARLAAPAGLSLTERLAGSARRVWASAERQAPSCCGAARPTMIAPACC
jgi:hypothetical protein